MYIERGITERHNHRCRWLFHGHWIYRCVVCILNAGWKFSSGSDFDETCLPHTSRLIDARKLGYFYTISTHAHVAVKSQSEKDGGNNIIFKNAWLRIIYGKMCLWDVLSSSWKQQQPLVLCPRSLKYYEDYQVGSNQDKKIVYRLIWDLIKLGKNKLTTSGHVLSSMYHAAVCMY